MISIVKKYVVIFVCFWIVFTKVLYATDSKSNASDNIAERIAMYYQYEKNNEWSKTYEMRTPRFREVVNKEFYVGTMKKDNNGWKIVEFNVLEIKEEEKKATVKIKFLEILSDDYKKLLNADNDKIETTVRTEWVKDKGVWYCYDAGMRLRLTLNIPFE